MDSSGTYPFLKKSEEDVKENSHEIKHLLEKLKEIQSTEENRKKSSAKIEVNDILRSAASLYEKVRSTIDFKDEHLLRQGAIKRILSRKLSFSLPDSEHIAQGIIYELIQSGYLKAELITEDQTNDVTNVINKYLALFKSFNYNEQRYFLPIAAAELEQLIVPHIREDALIEILVEIINKNISANIEEKDREHVKNIFLPVVAYQIFLKFDKPALKFFLLKTYYPQWTKIKITPEDVTINKKHLFDIIDKIEVDLESPIAKKLNKIVRSYNPQFIVLREIISKETELVADTLAHPRKLTIEVEHLANSHYAADKMKLFRAIIRAVAFVFITKMVLGILLEIPYEKYFLGEFHWLPLSINLVFPPVLMFISASLIGVPGAKNTQKLVKKIKQIVYLDEGTEPKEYYFKHYSFSSAPIGNGLKIAYFLTFLVIFGLIGWLLYSLNYNIVSGGLFYFFLSVVSFLAFRIRQSTKELVIKEDEKEGLWAGIADFLLLPFLRIGYWLAVKFEGINIFLFFLDFVIEAPFKIVLEVINRWIAFVKEKKEELIN